MKFIISIVCLIISLSICTIQEFIDQRDQIINQVIYLEREIRVLKRKGATRKMKAKVSHAENKRSMVRLIEEQISILRNNEFSSEIDLEKSPEYPIEVVEKAEEADKIHEEDKEIMPILGNIDISVNEAIDEELKQMVESELERVLPELESKTIEIKNDDLMVESVLEQPWLIDSILGLVGFLKKSSDADSNSAYTSIQHLHEIDENDVDIEEWTLVSEEE